MSYIIHSYSQKIGRYLFKPTKVYYIFMLFLKSCTNTTLGSSPRLFFRRSVLEAGKELGKVKKSRTTVADMSTCGLAEGRNINYILKKFGKRISLMKACGFLWKDCFSV